MNITSATMRFKLYGRLPHITILVVGDKVYRYHHDKAERPFLCGYFGFATIESPIAPGTVFCKQGEHDVVIGDLDCT